MMPLHSPSPRPLATNHITKPSHPSSSRFPDINHRGRPLANPPPLPLAPAPAPTAAAAPLPPPPPPAPAAGPWLMSAPSPRSRQAGSPLPRCVAFWMPNAACWSGTTSSSSSGLTGRCCGGTQTSSSGRRACGPQKSSNRSACRAAWRWTWVWHESLFWDKGQLERREREGRAGEMMLVCGWDGWICLYMERSSRSPGMPPWFFSFGDRQVAGTGLGRVGIYHCESLE